MHEVDTTSEFQAGRVSGVPSAGTYRFSLIAVCRNCAEYLPRFLEAVATQDFDLSHVEVVFVDDGSSDGSADIAAGFADRIPALRIVSTGAAGGSGCGGARNAGLAVATGEYVWHLDCDDYILPGALSRIDAALSAAQAESGVAADVCVFPFRVDRRGPGGKVSSDTRAQVAARLQEVATGPVAAWAKVIRRVLCIPFRPDVMMQDRSWHFAQVDVLDTFARVEGDDPVLVYDRTHATATTTHDWFMAHPRLLEQFITSQEIEGAGVDSRWISDFFMLVADMWRLRGKLKKSWVKIAWASRFRMICSNMATGRFAN